MKNISHLITFSDFSLLRGMIKCEDLAAVCKERGVGAVALTNSGNLMGSLRFQKILYAHRINPILGSEIMVKGNDEGIYPLFIIAKNISGYKSLCHLLSFGYKTRDRYLNEPLFYKEDLKMLQGVYAIAGFLDGEVGYHLVHKGTSSGQQVASGYAEIFGQDNFIVDIARVGRVGEDRYIYEALDLATKSGYPVVFTNYACFLNPDDAFAHRIKVKIHEHELGEHIPFVTTYQQYLKSYNDVVQLFDISDDLIANTNYIASQCSVDLIKHYTENRSVHFPTHPHLKEKSLYDDLKEIALRFLRDKRLDRAPYLERLETELTVLKRKGFLMYIAVIYDMVRWARDNDISIGPGRGSGAGSLLAYCLHITTVDPIVHGLIFERFLNIERQSIPDFDIDFCVRKRDQVVNYMTDTYGQDRTAAITTYLTFAARSAIREVARTLQVKNIHELLILLPNESQQHKTTISDITEQSEVQHLITKDVVIDSIMTLSRKLEGLVRGYGKHAAGIVITPQPLVSYMPVYTHVGSNLVTTNYDKDDLESLGMIKIDILGLSTLTTLSAMLYDIKKIYQHEIVLEDLALDDKATFDLVGSGKTCGIFQLETEGIQHFCTELKPTAFNDLAILIAIYRPGPLRSNLHREISQRKTSPSTIEYLCPEIKPYLEETYGILTYQEQIMFITSVMTGSSLGHGDKLQRAIGKKKQDEIKIYLESFYQQATARGFSPTIVKKISDYIVKFGGYGFNKSHACAYALLTYWTAYLKTHYPLIFYKNICSGDLKDQHKIRYYLSEYLSNPTHKLRKPNLELSEWDFSLKEDSLVIGLGSCRSVNKKLVDAICTIRSQHKITTIYDLHFLLEEVTNIKTIAGLKPLILSGALDTLSLDRNYMLASLYHIAYITKQRKKIADTSQLADIISAAEQESRYRHLYLSPKELQCEENRTLNYIFNSNVLTYDEVWQDKLGLDDITLRESIKPYYYFLLHVQDVFRLRDSDQYRIRTMDKSNNLVILHLSLHVFAQNEIQIDDTLIVRSTTMPFWSKKHRKFYLKHNTELRYRHLESFVNKKFHHLKITMHADYLELFLMLFSGIIKQDNVKHADTKKLSLIVQLDHEYVTASYSDSFNLYKIYSIIGASRLQVDDKIHDLHQCIHLACDES